MIHCPLQKVYKIYGKYIIQNLLQEVIDFWRIVLAGHIMRGNHVIGWVCCTLVVENLTYKPFRGGHIKMKCHFFLTWVGFLMRFYGELRMMLGNQNILFCVVSNFPNVVVLCSFNLKIYITWKLCNWCGFAKTPILKVLNTLVDIIVGPPPPPPRPPRG